MSNPNELIEVQSDLSDKNLPQPILDAIKESGLSPESYMESAVSNIKHIATLLKSCVDLYKDRKPALDHLGFSFVASTTVASTTVASTTVAKGADAYAIATQVTLGNYSGILYSLENLLQNTFNDVIKSTLKVDIPS